MVSRGVICYPQGLAIPAGLLDSAADVSYLHIKKNLNKTQKKKSQTWFFITRRWMGGANYLLHRCVDLFFTWYLLNSWWKYCALSIGLCVMLDICNLQSVVVCCICLPTLELVFGNYFVFRSSMLSWPFNAGFKVVIVLIRKTHIYGSARRLLYVIKIK